MILRMRRRLAGRPTGIVILAYTLIGLGLVLQPDRFSRTPAYGNLIHVFTAVTWGALYLAVAAGLALWLAGVTPIWFGTSAHTIAVMLVGGWLAAFVVRYATDSATTIVNVASWTVFLILTVQSSVSVYDDDTD